MDTTTAHLLAQACHHLEGACRGWLDQDDPTAWELFTLHEVVELQHALLRRADLDHLDPTPAQPAETALLAAADLLHQAAAQTTRDADALHLTGHQLRLRRLAEHR